MTDREQNGKTYKKWAAYGQSKSANMLMAVSLARKLGEKGLHAFSIHPGLVLGSGLVSHLDMTDPTAGDFSGLSTFISKISPLFNTKD